MIFKNLLLQGNCAPLQKVAQLLTLGWGFQEPSIVSTDTTAAFQRAVAFHQRRQPLFLLRGAWKTRGDPGFAIRTEDVRHWAASGL